MRRPDTSSGTERIKFDSTSEAPQTVVGIPDRACSFGVGSLTSSTSFTGARLPASGCASQAVLPAELSSLHQRRNSAEDDTGICKRATSTSSAGPRGDLS